MYVLRPRLVLWVEPERAFIINNEKMTSVKLKINLVGILLWLYSVVIKVIFSANLEQKVGWKRSWKSSELRFQNGLFPICYPYDKKYTLYLTDAWTSIIYQKLQRTPFISLDTQVCCHSCHGDRQELKVQKLFINANIMNYKWHLQYTAFAITFNTSNILPRA